MSIPTVFIFSNGNVAITDDKGEQIPELQSPWVSMIFDRILESGRDPLSFEYLLPDGRKAVPFRTTSGQWNWEVKP